MSNSRTIKKKHYNPGGMRRFHLNRATTGWQTHKYTVVGPGGKETPESCRVFHSDCIAQGCVFTKGFTVLRILGDEPRTETFETFEDFNAKYPVADDSHQYRWQDKCCFRCGSDIDRNHGPGFCDQCGASWDTPADWPDPESGGWVNALRIPVLETNEPKRK
jgi:hypothetical protein